MGVLEGVSLASKVRVGILDEYLLPQVPGIHQLLYGAVPLDELHLVCSLLPEEGEDAGLGGLEGNREGYPVVSPYPGIKDAWEGAQGLLRLLVSGVDPVHNSGVVHLLEPEVGVSIFTEWHRHTGH